jgi:purine-cytosine permease-like protein
MALVIHRVWQSLGFKLYTWLAWFITFNFINISWVFFRAKEWDDAMKVLGGMFSGEFVIPTGGVIDKYLHFDCIIFSNNWLGNIFADKYIIWYLIGAFLLVFFGKNSMQMGEKFKTNLAYLLLFIVLFISSFLNLSGVHEFLYFNF